MLHSTNRVTLELRHPRSGNLRYVRDNRIVVAIIRIAEVFVSGRMLVSVSVRLISGQMSAETFWKSSVLRMTSQYGS